MAQQIVTEVAVEAAKAAPPLAVVCAGLGGVTLQDWVYIATLAYLAIQGGWLCWRWYRAWSTKGWSPE